jgi:hypothetical protein
MEAARPPPKIKPPFTLESALAKVGISYYPIHFLSSALRPAIICVEAGIGLALKVRQKFLADEADVCL